jgi:penicillin amidase
MTSTRQQIAVKGEQPVTLNLRSSPHGPIVNNVLGATAGTAPIAMWWSFLESENPILEGFYEANRADTLEKMRAAAEKIQAPGLNIIWANTKGDIGWWAAAQLPIRPEGVNPNYMLDGSTGQAGLLPVQSQPSGRKPGAGLYRFCQCAAGFAHWHADPWLLQPRRPWSAIESAVERFGGEVESGQQQATATGHPD